MTRPVIRWGPVRDCEVILRAERTDARIQRKRFGVTAEVSGDLGLAVAPGIHADSHARRPIVVEGVASVYAFHVLLFPAHAGADGHVLAGTPRILREDRMVEGGGLEVQKSKFSAILAQEDRYAPVRAFRHTRDIEFRVINVVATSCWAAVPHLERCVRAIGNQSIVQRSLQRVVWIEADAIYCSCGVDRNSRTRPKLGAVIVRAVITVPKTQGVLPKEVEHLLGIEVQAVVVSYGVFVVAETLAHVLPTQRVSGGGAFRTEHWRPTRIPLNPVGNYVGVRESGRVAEVVVAPGPGGIEQPGRAKRAVIASSNVASAILQLVERCL